jgi:dephospho-CoA kinase
VVHEIYEDPEVRDLVVARWGEEVAPDGAVDRAAIARHAFASPQEREWLEGLIWPRVGERVMGAREQAGERVLVVEVPLLFESGLDRGYDATIAVVAPEELRRERAAARGHEAVDERTSRQLSQEEKARRATYVVSNDGTVADLEAKLSEVLEKLTER